MAQCLSYYSPQDADGFPTCGQMQGYLPSNLPCNAICNQILLPPVQMTIPDRSTQCLHPNGLRYFYRTVPYSSPIVVQPNSLICAYSFPKSPNDCFWLEYYKIC